MVSSRIKLLKEFVQWNVNRRFEYSLLSRLLIGCMKEVWINHKLVDFLNAIKQQKIRPGCGSPQEEEPQQQQPPQQPQQQEPHPHIMDDDSEGYVQEHIMEPAGEYAKPFSSGSRLSSGGAVPPVVTSISLGAAFCLLLSDYVFTNLIYAVL